MDPRISLEPIRHHDIAMIEFNQGAWSLAIPNFRKALEFGSNNCQTLECLAKSYLHEYRRQAKEFEKTGAGRDGTACYEMAVEYALQAAAQFERSRWQPHFLLADIFHERQQYTLATSHMSKTLQSLKIMSSARTPKEMSTIRAHAERLADALQRIHQSESSGYRATIDDTQCNHQSLKPVEHPSAFERLSSPDILLLIVESGRLEDPGLPVRLSGVSRHLRGILVNCQALWQDLILGKSPAVPLVYKDPRDPPIPWEGRGTRMVHKTQTYLARCAKGLRGLTINEDLDWERSGILAILLAAQAPHIERFAVVHGAWVGNTVMPLFEGAMASLRTLTTSSPDDRENETIDRLDFRLLPSGSDTLEELSLTGIIHSCAGSYGVPATPHCWIDRPSVRLANVEVLRLDDCTFESDIKDFRDLLQYMPKIREVYLHGVVFGTNADAEDPYPWLVPPIPYESLLRLEHLATWSMDMHPINGWETDNTVGSMPFHTMSAPGLITLSLASCTSPDLNLPCWDLVEVFQSEGLREALPNLRSLAIIGFPIPEDFIDIIDHMPSLQSLKLPECDLTRQLQARLAEGIPVGNLQEVTVPTPPPTPPPAPPSPDYWY